jgi:class 3 adenylate cyclase/dihydrofolate reductase
VRYGRGVGRLIAVEFMTLDGVMEAPGFDEHRSGRNAWALRHADDELQAYNLGHLEHADAILFGRTTYDIWAAFWPTMPPDDPFGSRINALPKYVVSTTLERAAWAGTTIVRGDVATEIGALKDRFDEIVLFGSADLFAAVVAHGLVDEYRILVYPVILGSGKRLFRDEAELAHLRLLQTRTFDSGVVLVVYEAQPDAPVGKFSDDYAWTDAQRASLHAAQDTDRVLATVLFTDIVDSTGRAAALGDRPWRQLLDRHDEVARTEIERWHGKLVKSTGDGVLATFDAPTRALRCAFGLRSGLGRLGLDVRIAVHTGEVELRGGDVGGIGIHIAARALAEATAGDIVATRTVRDLATGADMAFRPLGSVSLRGVPGLWELFSAALGERDAAR